jgi:hypothetical protein
MGTSKIISAEDLMDLAAIDGAYNLPRVKSWQDAAESEIISFTGLDFNNIDLCSAKTSEFYSVCKVYLQERVRELFLAPNYEPRGIDNLKIRLSLIADEIKEILGSEYNDEM